MGFIGRGLVVSMQLVDHDHHDSATALLQSLCMFGTAMTSALQPSLRKRRASFARFL
ncbi:hypothetical protein [Burkholderia sp. PAMC 28687]|uniref:hypothetical protein n=1 Tax=Burkholderia sp. PAMC 28687 TaxID=1795874 RepID=UPI000AE3597C|nr:hypothetical protein [Burkholderia sp. PAMC 28687]